MFTRETPGTTAANLSKDPLATEAEATPGPSDWNPFEDDRLSEDDLRELDLTGYSPVEDRDMGFEPSLPDF